VNCRKIPDFRDHKKLKDAQLYLSGAMGQKPPNLSQTDTAIKVDKELKKS